MTWTPPLALIALFVSVAETTDLVGTLLAFVDMAVLAVSAVVITKALRGNYKRGNTK
jgi:hypothetical protein